MQEALSYYSLLVKLHEDEVLVLRYSIECSVRILPGFVFTMTAAGHCMKCCKNNSCDQLLWRVCYAWVHMVSQPVRP